MNTLEQLTILQRWLTAFRPLPADVLEELRHRFEVRLTYHSTAIEGNTLTQSETQIVIEKGITIGGKSVREHLEVVGHKAALDFIIELADAQELIDERAIRDVHSHVMKGQDDFGSGGYRTLNVKAAGTDFTYPDHLHVPELMADYVSWLNNPGDVHPVELATEAHLRFVTIHPFRDGNGRVGRLLMNLILLRVGYTIAVIPVERRAEYIDALVVAQTGEGRARLTGLVTDAVDTSLRETLETCVSSTEALTRITETERTSIATALS
jgi:Fic family protein